VQGGPVENWGARLYGNPCRECGFDWSVSAEAAMGMVADVPVHYDGLLAHTDGSQRHPDLNWTAGAYVCHVGDNLRIWAERLAGAALGGSRQVPGYDENLLARARAYERIHLAGALWSLQRAARDWQEAVHLALERDVVLLHARRGEQLVTDIARNNAHDAYHHGWDIRRSIL